MDRVLRLYPVLLEGKMVDATQVRVAGLEKDVRDIKQIISSITLKEESHDKVLFVLFHFLNHYIIDKTIRIIPHEDYVEIDNYKEALNYYSDLYASILGQEETEKALEKAIREEIERNNGICKMKNPYTCELKIKE